MFVLIKVFFESVEDMHFVATEVRDLPYTVTTNEQSKAMTLESASAFAFVQQFCEIFDIPMTFWIEMYN